MKLAELIQLFISSYQYSSAHRLMRAYKYDDERVINIAKVCKCTRNFDFENAHEITKKLIKDGYEDSEIKTIEYDLRMLCEGNPHNIFSELLMSLYIEMYEQEYIDFVGRLYRFRESIMKYVFRKEHNNINKIEFYNSNEMQFEIKQELKNTYGINDSVVFYGIEEFIRQNKLLKEKYKTVLHLLNSKEFKKIIDMRNETIVGHGFRGVSKQEIIEAYKEPKDILNDLKIALQSIDLQIDLERYDRINEYLIKIIESEQNHNER